MWSPTGRLHAVDVQPKMLAGLRRRLEREGLAGQADLRLASTTDLGTDDLAGTIDLAVLIYVLHEVPDPARMVRQVVRTLGPHARLLLLEPKGHCSAALFAEETALLRDAGLVPLAVPAGLPVAGRQVAWLGQG